MRLFGESGARGTIFLWIGAHSPDYCISMTGATVPSGIHVRELSPVIQRVLSTLQLAFPGSWLHATSRMSLWGRENGHSYFPAISPWCSNISSKGIFLSQELRINAGQDSEGPFWSHVLTPRPVIITGDLVVAFFFFGWGSLYPLLRRGWGRSSIRTIWNRGGKVSLRKQRYWADKSSVCLLHRRLQCPQDAAMMVQTKRPMSDPCLKRTVKPERLPKKTQPCPIFLPICFWFSLPVPSPKLCLKPM